MKYNTPFKYPKSKYKRKFFPQYKTNKSYKAVLRKEFGNICVYCRMPDFLKVDSFGVDHYKPKEIFPELEWNYRNLFYACNTCNSRKGSYWPTSDLLKTNIFLPNPCDHVMYEHLRYEGVIVNARSKAGELADKLLDFNDKISLSYRESINYIIQKLFVDFEKINATISKLKKLIEKEVVQEKKSEIIIDINRHEKKVQKIKQRLNDCGINI